MANILNITAADSGKTFALRGDMGVALNFTPPNNNFRVAFMTQDAGSFIVGSTTRMFRALNLAAQSSLSVGGKVGLFIELMYDPDKGEFVVTKNNLVAGEATGSGGAGTAATITVAQTVTGAPGSSALVENIGSASAVQLKFTIPAGTPGTNGTGGGAGTALPAGGTAGQVLTKSGSTDYAVAWATPQAGSGGSAGTNSPEVTITPDGSGNITLNQALGYNFRLVLTSNATLMNPVGYTSGDHIKLVIVQGAGAPWVLGFDRQWAFADASPPGLGSVVGAINRITADLTGGDTWLADVTPDKVYAVGYAPASPISRIGTTQYYYMGTPTYNPTWVSSMVNVQSGQTIYVLRSGRHEEVTGTITGNGGTYTVAGAPIAASGERRPLLQLDQTDFGAGGANRPSFGKALLNFEGSQTTEIRDLRLTGARNVDGDARGIAQNGQSQLTIRNVTITNCNNGVLTDNLSQVPLTIIDSLLDGNGIGTPNTNANQGFNSTGYVHNIYTGHNGQTFTALRSSFTNCQTGHDIKSRCAVTILDQVYAGGSVAGRGLDNPNGGIVHATNCTFEKFGNATQNNLVAIGNTFDVGPGSEEGIDTSRTREYIFRNCRFINPIDAARNGSFLATKDPNVAVQFIDCEFVGAGTLAKTLNNPFDTDPNYAGMVITKGVYHMPGKPPVWTLTGGPVGPLLAVGRPATVAMTAVV